MYCVHRIKMNRYINIIKLTWMITSLLFILIIIVQKKGQIYYIINNIPLFNILIALLFIFGGKIFLIYNMYFSLTNVNVKLPYIICFEIYNTSQIAKYIPGSIWHFVGRIEIYRRKGIDIKKIRQSLLYENIAILCGSFFCGMIFILISDKKVFNKILYTLYDNIMLYYFLSILFVVLLIIIIFGNYKYNKLKINIQYVPIFKTILLQCMVWICLGTSLWFIIIPFNSSDLSIYYTISLFAFAYAVGFLTPFAPAGLGAREGILVLGLSGYFQPINAIGLAGISRILYIFAEIILYIISITIPKD